MTGVKETNFFALEGTSVNRDGDQSDEQLGHYPWSITDWDEYQGLYENAGNVSKSNNAPILIGTLTPSI